MGLTQDPATEQDQPEQSIQFTPSGLPATMTPEYRRIFQQAQLVLPIPVIMRLRQAFTPRGAQFFEFYVSLKAYEMGIPVPPDLRMRFTRLANILSQVTSPVDHRPLSPVVINHLAESRSQMLMLLGRLVQGKTQDNITWARINDIMVPVIILAARDKGVYLTYRQVGPRHWAFMRRMNPSQAELERLKDEDPEAYAAIRKNRQTLKEIDANIEKTVRRAGLVPERAYIAGAPAIVGKDRVTGERVVYDRDGDVLPVQDYVRKRIKRVEENKRLATVPERTQVPIEDLRRLTDEEVDRLPGKVTMHAITDDKAKQGRLTRIFATKVKRVIVTTSTGESRVEERAVISNGRYKGVFLDDMVNGEGRMIEGTAYTYNPETGRTGHMPVRLNPGQREPYITTAVVPTYFTHQGKRVKRNVTRLFVKIPGERKYTQVRRQLKDICCNNWRTEKSRCIDTIVWDEHKGHAAGFYFDPKDFRLISSILQGVSMSSSAVELIRDYYKDLSNAEKATAEENLAHYSPEQIGGFKTTLKNGKPFNLLTVQKKFLAWLDANGNRGVCALDTGIGKTLTAIAAMQKMTRDGLADEDASYTTPNGKVVKTNGRYLYVCPKEIRGGFGSDARKFLEEGPRALLMNRVDIMSYGTFISAAKSRKWKGKPWNPEEYVAIFFDEAQTLLKPSRARLAISIWHPRKICMTASPMERNPMEAYIMAAITNNTELFGRTQEARASRTEMGRFKKRYCEVIGGRIVGVNQDPVLKQDLHTWVRRNIFYADKRDVTDSPVGKLPGLTSQTVPLEMHPQVEDTYRTVTRHFANVLGGMVVKFRDLGRPTAPGAPSATNPDIERALKTGSREFGPVIRLLNDLANAPAKAFRTIADIIETGTIETRSGPKPIPKSMVGLVKVWKSKFTPEGLRALADTINNPKLDEAEKQVKSKLDRTNGSSRTILFSDDPDLCMMTARRMAETVAGRHAVGLAKSFHIFDGTGEIKELRVEIDPVVLESLVKDPAERNRILQETGGLSRFELPFTEKSYRKFPELPTGKGNVVFRASQWQKFVLDEIIQPDQSIRTLTLFGTSYALGQNLQAFDTVIHLDRDTWNAEMMKQRTARAWRQGQKNPVDEITLDATYRSVEGGTEKSDFDLTLDEIRGYFQQLDSSIFDQIIRDSMGVELGREWDEIKRTNASAMRIEREVLDLALSPYAARSEPPGV